MPRGRPKKVYDNQGVPAPSVQIGNEGKINELENNFRKLQESVDKLVSFVEKKEVKTEIGIETGAKIKLDEKQEKQNAENTEMSQKINQQMDYLRDEIMPGTEKIVSTIKEMLGNDFGIRFESEGDGFLTIHIILPERLDYRDPGLKEIFKCDIRSFRAPAAKAMEFVVKRCGKIRDQIRTYAPNFRMVTSV